MKTAILSHRMVQDPLMTDALYIYQRSKHPEKPNLGKVQVQENLTTRIGGLALIQDRLAHHERAAERFKTEYERLYGSGNPAIDAGRVQVDTTIMAHDAGMAARVDRGRDLRDAMDALGKEDADLLIAVLVLCIPLKDISETGHWRENKRLKADLLNCLDNLAVRWKYMTKTAINGRVA